MSRERSRPIFSSFLSDNSRKILSCAILLMLSGLVFSAGCFDVPPGPDNVSLSLPGMTEPGMTGVLNFSGTGDYQTGSVFLSGIVTILAETSGDGPFILSLWSPDGPERILFDEPGPFAPSLQYFVASVEIPAENYTISILSPGSWNVSLGPGEKAFFSYRSDPFVLAGTGSQRVELPQMSDGTTVLKGYCRTPGNISVDISINQSTIRRLHEEEGGIQTAYPLSARDSSTLNITADAAWIVEVTQPKPEHALRFDSVAGTGSYVSAYYQFSDARNQELAVSNAGNSAITVTLYAAEGNVLETFPVPPNTWNMHHRFFAAQKQIIPFTALIVVTAEHQEQWRIEECEYRVYFRPGTGRDFSGTVVSRPGPVSADFPAFMRFVDSGGTAAWVPAGESEIQQLMQSNVTLVEYDGRYYSVTISS